ncbi:MAG: hypothetical protein LBT11_07360 [Treponema sp.]|nr:hypothetical protein [Treponema sp.]
MQTAAYGVYKQGQILLNEAPSVFDNSPVIVVFLEQKPAEKPKLRDFFTLCGAWEDTRNADAIIADIRGSRTARDDVRL